MMLMIDTHTHARENQKSMRCFFFLLHFSLLFGSFSSRLCLLSNIIGVCALCVRILYYLYFFFPTIWNEIWKWFIYDEGPRVASLEQQTCSYFFSSIVILFMFILLFALFYSSQPYFFLLLLFCAQQHEYNARSILYIWKINQHEKDRWVNWWVE